MESKPPPVGRTHAPPPVTGIALEQSGPPPVGATSIYEAHNLTDPGDGDVQIMILDRDLVLIETLAPAAEIRSPRRAVPVVIPSTRPAAPTIIPVVVDPAADPGGPWTREVAIPMPVIREMKMVQNAPPAPKPKRTATVKFTSFGPADKAEHEWVIGGATGMRLVTTDETGRPRLVAVYLAFQVDSYGVDDASPDQVTVFGKVRWHGMPPDRDVAWQNKFLRREGGRRLEEFRAALEKFFAFADPRIGMVDRFLAGPATTRQAALDHGYQDFPGDGSPSIKFMVDMSGIQKGAQRAIDFYREAQDLVALPFRLWWWERFNRARAALYTLGERYDREGIPSIQVKDGLSVYERARLHTEVAATASGPVASLGKVAWRGDQQIEAALLDLKMAPVAHTTYTVYEGE